MGSYELGKKGVARFDWRDPYRLAVALTWPQFLAGLFGLYLVVNFAFALVFFLAPGAVQNARPGSFIDAFFFSFETLATVGYGEMYPATLYGHVAAAAEIMVGMTFTAILTGLTFVRFSRPRPSFIFAEQAVVARHNGMRTLMLRVGNGSATVMADAHAKLSVLLAEQTLEGNRMRRAHSLALIRSHNTIFPLSWTIMHVIDETSPLHGMDSDGFFAAGARLFLTFEARDPTLASTVHAMRDYDAAHIRFGSRYVDMISEDEHGRPLADMTKIHDVEADV